MSYCVASKSTFHKTYFLQDTLDWQADLHSDIYVGKILRDLSKVFDCLSHDLLIAKLETYGLDVGSRLNFLLDYLSLRKHRTKVGFLYSKWYEIC